MTKHEPRTIRHSGFVIPSSFVIPSFVIHLAAYHPQVSSLMMVRHSHSETSAMQRIARDQAKKYAFDWRDEPLLRVEPGETFEIETYDASTGYFKSADDKAIPARRPGFDRSPPLANPIGGPVWVAGAERGDVLVVTIERSSSTITRGSPSARGAARSANRPAGPNCPATTRPRSSATRRAPAAPPATARCISTNACRGRSRRSSARWASLPTAR